MNCCAQYELAEPYHEQAKTVHFFFDGFVVNIYTNLYLRFY